MGRVAPTPEAWQGRLAAALARVARGRHGGQWDVSLGEGHGDSLVAPAALHEDANDILDRDDERP